MTSVVATARRPLQLPQPQPLKLLRIQTVKVGQLAPPVHLPTRAMLAIPESIPCWQTAAAAAAHYHQVSISNRGTSAKGGCTPTELTSIGVEVAKKPTNETALSRMANFILTDLTKTFGEVVAVVTTAAVAAAAAATFRSSSNTTTTVRKVALMVEMEVLKVAMVLLLQGT